MFVCLFVARDVHRRGGKALLFAIAVSSLGTTDGPMMHVKQTKPALSKDEGNLKSTSNVLFTLNQTTLFKCLYEYPNEKLRYKDLIYFILKLLA